MNYVNQRFGDGGNCGLIQGSPFISSSKHEASFLASGLLDSIPSGKTRINAPGASAQPASRTHQPQSRFHQRVWLKPWRDKARPSIGTANAARDGIDPNSRPHLAVSSQFHGHGM